MFSRGHIYASQRSSHTSFNGLNVAILQTLNTFIFLILIGFTFSNVNITNKLHQKDLQSGI